jgi:hypothetical protein
MSVVLHGRLTQQSLFQNALGGLVQQVLLWMGNRHQPRFCRVLEVVMAASDAYQIPTVRNDVTYQISAIHNTSLWCVMVVTITTEMKLSTLYLPVVDDRRFGRWSRECMSAAEWRRKEVLRGFAAALPDL